MTCPSRSEEAGRNPVRSIGPDGSGRSEVLQLAAGLIGAFTSGRVEIGGHNLDHLPESDTRPSDRLCRFGSVHVWTGTLRDNLWSTAFGTARSREPERSRRCLEKAEYTSAGSLEAQARPSQPRPTTSRRLWEDLERQPAARTIEEASDARAHRSCIDRWWGLPPMSTGWGCSRRIDPAERTATFAERILTRAQGELDRQGWRTIPTLCRIMIELWQVEDVQQLGVKSCREPSSSQRPDRPGDRGPCHRSPPIRGCQGLACAQQDRPLQEARGTSARKHRGDDG